VPFVHAVDEALLRPIDCSRLARLGSRHDGGYVVPVDAITNAKTLLSFGIARDWSFERDARTLNPALSIQAYDPSIDGSRFAGEALRSSISVLLRMLSMSMRGARSSLRRVRTSIDYFRFFHGPVKHHPKRIWYNGDRGSVSIERAIADSGPHADLSIFAKIDIEGTEYRILPTIVDQARLFTGLAIEFHDTDICAHLFNQQMRSLSRSFAIAHVHGNNYGDLSIDGALPLSLEISLVNRRLVACGARAYAGPLPRPGLDRPNNPDAPDYPIEWRTPGGVGAADIRRQ
jgi:hypothetical protein